MQLTKSISISIPTIETDSRTKLPPYIAVGIRPTAPTLFFDIDVKQEPDNIVWKEMAPRYYIPLDVELNKIKELDSILEQIESYLQLKERRFWMNHIEHEHCAIYRTKDGYHLVREMPTWDRVQYALRELKNLFPNSNYMMDCRRLRLRVSPKYDIATGEVISPEPYLFESCKCYHELRVGIEEKYYTYD